MLICFCYTPQSCLTLNGCMLLQEDLKHRAEQAQKNFNIYAELAKCCKVLFVFHVSNFGMPLSSRKPVMLGWPKLRCFLFFCSNFC